MTQQEPVTPPDPTAQVSAVDLIRIHQPDLVADVSFCKECSHIWPCKTAMLAGVTDDEV